MYEHSFIHTSPDGLWDYILHTDAEIADNWISSGHDARIDLLRNHLRAVRRDIFLNEKCERVKQNSKPH